MCEFCTKHGDGKIWYKNVRNYANDLAADLARRTYIRDFFQSTIRDGFVTLGRLETLFNKKRRLRPTLITKIVNKAKAEHFGQVLPIEEIQGIVRQAETVVRMPCACRWVAQNNEKRCCYGVSYSANAWYQNLDMRYFGKAEGECLEYLAKEEAIRQMERLEEEGAIHTIWTMITPFIGTICNCTARECLGLRTLRSVHVETIARAEQVALVESHVCNGCGVCEDVCQFDAIASRLFDGKTVATISSRQCFGCGLCRNSCPHKAISLADR